MPESALPSTGEALDRSATRFSDRPPMQRVRLPGNFFVTNPLKPPLPTALAERPIDIAMPTGGATFDDLVFILDEAGVTTAFSWQGGEATSDLLARPLPFRRYRGTVGGLLSKLRNTVNVASWYEDGAVFFSPFRQYAVSLPPVSGTINLVADEISQLGAEEVQPSLIGGQLTYTASPALNDQVIEPYLRRIAHNLSEVTVQIAIATVTISEAQNRGFDWDTFTAEITENVGENPPFRFGRLDAGSLSGRIVNDQFELFGTSLTLSVAGAIDFLSTFGNTTIEQNIELRSISGNAVEIQDTQNIPFVEQIRETTTDNSNSAEVDFGEVETGLTVTLVPRFQAQENMVTMEITLDLVEFIEFLTIEVPLGDATSDVQRPITETRALTDIVRVPAGQTVMIGGLTEDSVSDDRNAPFALWDIGGSSRSISRNAVFIIIRPIVTLYEFADNPLLTAQSVTPRSLPLVPPNPATTPATPMTAPAPAPAPPAANAADPFGAMLDSILEP